MPPQLALPADLAVSRADLQRVATHILARRRSAATGRIGLRPTPGGFGTPAAGDDRAEVLRVVPAAVIHEVAGRSRALTMTSLGDLASALDIDLSSPFTAGRDTPDLGNPSAPLRISEDATRFIGRWFAFVGQVLDRVVVALGPDADPSAVQIWPEHFDAALDARHGDGPDGRVNLGGSPGDAAEPGPYLYVGPWAPVRPGPPEFWNAPFGAVLRYADLADLDDAGLAQASAFMLRGWGLLARGQGSTRLTPAGRRR